MLLNYLPFAQQLLVQNPSCALFFVIIISTCMPTTTRPRFLPLKMANLLIFVWHTTVLFHLLVCVQNDSVAETTWWAVYSFCSHLKCPEYSRLPCLAAGLTDWEAVDYSIPVVGEECGKCVFSRPLDTEVRATSLGVEHHHEKSITVTQAVYWDDASASNV